MQVPAGTVSIPLQPSQFHFRWESNVHVGKGTLRRIYGVECGHFKGAIKLPRATGSRGNSLITQYEGEKHSPGEWATT